MVFVPTFVRRGFFIFNAVQTQEFVILFLGSLAILIFLFLEKKMKKNFEEKCLIQSQANRMTKDLQNSYTYIGEINRKLDILENIALGYPETSKLSQKAETELYSSIMSAIKLFGKSDEIALRFVCLTDLSIVKEIKSIPEKSMEFSLKDHRVEFNYFESDEFIVATSPKAIDNIFSYIVFKKKKPSQKLEDIEIMKTLASQALFIYMFMHHKKKIQCTI
jgi:hypothetical protein